MLRAITCLLFGGEEQTPDDFKSEQMPEEEWQVVSHQGQPQKMLLGLKTEHRIKATCLIRSTGTELCVIF